METRVGPVGGRTLQWDLGTCYGLQGSQLRRSNLEKTKGEGNQRLGTNGPKGSKCWELSSPARRVGTFCQETLPCYLGLEYSHDPQMRPYTLMVSFDPALSDLWKPYFLWIVLVLAFHISGTTQSSVTYAACPKFSRFISR